MAVVREFLLPDLGEGLTEAEVVRWLVEVGDHVDIDQQVVEVETAKAVVEVPCPYAGVVTARFGDEGTQIPVGSPLITVAVSSGTADGSSTADGSGSAGAGGGAETDSGSGNVLVGYGTSTASSRRRRVKPGAPQRKAPSATGPTAPEPESGSGPGPGPGPERPGPERHRRLRTTAKQQPGPSGDRVTGPVAVISPLVRRIAREHGLDLRAVLGTGPEGLILRSDVERAVAPAQAPAGRGPMVAPAPMDRAATEPMVGRPPADEAVLRIPLKGLRRTVADKLSRSRREIPEATCWVDADATELLAARAAMNAGAEDKVSLLAVLARIATAALARHPELNSSVDMERQEIVRFPSVGLGFAAQTERGLVVPVLRGAERMSTAELSRGIAGLTESARTGSLTPAELTGGTFTLNNYGVFGVDGSTPIINHPEAAMLGVGRIVPKPWVHAGELAVRHVVQLSLTFDHRVCDGGTAGGFLRFVADCVEQPTTLLRHL